MKRLVIFTAAFLALVSCEVQPEAYFYADKVTAEIGEEIFFTNSSYNATSFKWDFGDGTWSDAVNVSHTYNATGIYSVVLTAWSPDGWTDRSFLDVEIVSPTMLEIEVLEWYDEYPVQGASVILYPTLKDWDNETNAITEGFTDARGKVVFTGLGPYVYYVDVWHQVHNNYTLRDEDPAFIRTPRLVEGSLNTFTAWVDYTGTKGEASVRDRSRTIKPSGRIYSTEGKKKN